MTLERKHLEAIEEAARKLMPAEPCDEECDDCVDDRKLLDAIHAALAAFDNGPWLNIDSAPKDGTPISVLSKYNNAWYHVWWYVPTNPRSRQKPHWKSNLGAVPFEPVKWSPLPAAPEANTNG